LGLVLFHDGDWGSPGLERAAMSGT
jgi:hypothetical protein